MRKSIVLTGVLAMAAGALGMTACGNRKEKKDTYDDKGRLEVSIRNLYFGKYSGGDTYLDQIGDKFGLNFELSTYDWDNWQTQVNGAINGDNMTDVFHANIDSYNFAQLYKFWAEEKMIKPLPSDLSQWPNLKTMIENTTNIDSLKLDNVLYGIPVAKNTTDYSTTFSPFTYVYRRDWAKEWGVYQENDEYTWDQFQNLLNVFKTNLASKTNSYALADVEWGYPSITNFYKTVPHCYAQDETGKYVNNYTTPEYLDGLDMSKSMMNEGAGVYHPEQNTAPDGRMNENYYSNRVGVFYENLSYTNYNNLRLHLRETNASRENFNIDDATAIMKIKGPDGKYALEGTDNWFAMTFFDYKISDEKQAKILDLFDWLLSEEGTRYAIYGEEDFDYVMVDGKPQIIEENWPIGSDGTRTGNINGAKYLRYCISLGYDTLSYDPVSNLAVVEYLNNWEAQMRQALNNGTLRVLKENKDVMWLTTAKKSLNSGNMRTQALKNVMNYTYNKNIHTRDEFKATFGNIWDIVLDEINTALGKK